MSCLSPDKQVCNWLAQPLMHSVCWRQLCLKWHPFPRAAPNSEGLYGRVQTQPDPHTAPQECA